jgi:hypothetical protein
VVLAAMLAASVPLAGHAEPFTGNSGANAGMGSGFNCGRTEPVWPPGYGMNCGPSPGLQPKQHATSQSRASRSTTGRGQTATPATPPAEGNPTNAQ